MVSVRTLMCFYFETPFFSLHTLTRVTLASELTAARASVIYRISMSKPFATDTPQQLSWALTPL